MGLDDYLIAGKRRDECNTVVVLYGPPEPPVVARQEGTEAGRDSSPPDMRRDCHGRRRSRAPTLAIEGAHDRAVVVTAVTATGAAGEVQEDAGARPAQRCERQRRRQVLPPALPLQLLCSRAAAHMAR